MFRTKREGVAFVLDAVEAAFPSAADQRVCRGRLFRRRRTRRGSIRSSVAAANWSATAHHLARHVPDTLLVDIGTTTTDIIPIVGGKWSRAGVRIRSGSRQVSWCTPAPSGRRPRRSPATCRWVKGWPACRRRVLRWLATCTCGAAHSIPRTTRRRRLTAGRDARIRRRAAGARRVRGSGDARRRRSVARSPMHWPKPRPRASVRASAVCSGSIRPFASPSSRAWGRSSVSERPNPSDCVCCDWQTRLAAMRRAVRRRRLWRCCWSGPPNRLRQGYGGPPTRLRQRLRRSAEASRRRKLYAKAEGGHYQWAVVDQTALVDTVVKLGGGVLVDEARFDAVLASISVAARQAAVGDRSGRRAVCRLRPRCG